MAFAWVGVAATGGCAAAVRLARKPAEAKQVSLVPQMQIGSWQLAVEARNSRAIV